MSVCYSRILAVFGGALVGAASLPFLYGVPATRKGFVDVTAQSGLAGFRNLQGEVATKPHIVEVMGGGAAFLDYNNDGLLDIVLVRGSTIRSFRDGDRRSAACIGGTVRESSQT